MKYEIGKAWAILKGLTSGNKQEAYSMLNGLKPEEYRSINKEQGKVRARIKAKAPRVGDHPDKRWGV